MTISDSQFSHTPQTLDERKILRIKQGQIQGNLKGKVDKWMDTKS